MSFAGNCQLQIKLEFYVESIALKDDPCDAFRRYLLFCNVSGSNNIFSNSGHMSQHVSQNSNILILKLNVTLEYLSFQFIIQKVLFSYLTQEADCVV